jgi:hypothetical protein
MQLTYLTTEELAERIKYSKYHIRNHLVDNVLIEGLHYTRPFGGRKILFIWENVEKAMGVTPRDVVPLASGGVCHG